VDHCEFIGQGLGEAKLCRATITKDVLHIFQVRGWMYGATDCNANLTSRVCPVYFPPISSSQGQSVSWLHWPFQPCGDKHTIGTCNHIVMNGRKRNLLQPSNHLGDHLIEILAGEP
jgi:hypothetical protein